MIVFHTLQGSPTSFLLGHTDEIYLSAKRNSVISLRCIWTYYKMPKDKLTEQSELISTAAPFGFLKIVPETGDVSFFSLQNETDDNDEAGSVSKASGSQKSEKPSQRVARLSKKGTDYLNFMPNSNAAGKVFKIIMAILPESSIDNDLIFTFENTKTGELHKVNILDYVYFCVDPEARPSSAASKFHKFILKKGNLPIMFVKNKHLRKLSLA